MINPATQQPSIELKIDGFKSDYLVLPDCMDFPTQKLWDPWNQGYFIKGLAMLCE